jgi:hypothetical protein
LPVDPHTGGALDFCGTDQFNFSENVIPGAQNAGEGQQAEQNYQRKQRMNFLGKMA